MSCVLDASAVLAQLLDEPAAGEVADAMLAFAGDGFLVPAHWPLEVANGLHAAVRRRRIAWRDARTLARKVAALPVTLGPAGAPAELAAILDDCRALDLTAYDLAYLRLAEEARAPLVTLDANLRRACARRRIVAVPA